MEGYSPLGTQMSLKGSDARDFRDSRNHVMVLTLERTGGEALAKEARGPAEVSSRRQAVEAVAQTFFNTNTALTT